MSLINDNEIIIDETQDNIKIFRINFQSVAYIKETKQEIYIMLLTTDPNNRSRGLGSKLLKYILDYYKSKEIYTLVPDNFDVETENKTINFFKKHSFIENNDIYKRLDYLNQI